ncbi:MAG: CARDB domain-containing protein [Dongiaceae bacterium]
MSRISSKARLMTASGLMLVATSGAAFAAPDLVPDTGNLTAAGEAAVINMGDQASEPSQLIITCQKTSGAGGCAEGPAMATHEDPAYPDAAVINVPALEPGETYAHALPFWGSLSWSAGTHELILIADAGDVVIEDDETNNAAIAEKQQLASVGTSPVPIGPGILTIEPQAGGGFPFKLQFSFGQ